MPEITTISPPIRRNGLSPASSSTPGARARRGLPARLADALRRTVATVRSRAAEILRSGFRYEESAVPYIQCEHCGDIHPQNVRCGARATGYCENETRRRLLNGSRCSVCGSRSVTDVHFRWAVQGGKK